MIFPRWSIPTLYFENNEIGIEGEAHTYIELTENDYFRIPIEKEMIKNIYGSLTKYTKYALVN